MAFRRSITQGGGREALVGRLYAPFNFDNPVRHVVLLEDSQFKIANEIEPDLPQRQTCR